MADDSEWINEIFEFHPSNTPRGTLYYKLGELTVEQQERLNTHKINAIRKNQKYLHDHPEVKIITSALLKAVLKARPKYHIHKFFVQYLAESWTDLKKEVDQKISERERKKAIQKQRMLTLAYLKELYEDEEFEEAEEIDDKYIQKIMDAKNKRDVRIACRNVLDNIIDTMEVMPSFITENDSSNSLQFDLQDLFSNNFDSDYD